MLHGRHQQALLGFAGNNRRPAVAALKNRLAAIQLQPSLVLVPVTFETMRRQHRPNLRLKEIRLRIRPTRHRQAQYQRDHEPHSFHAKSVASGRDSSSSPERFNYFSNTTFISRIPIAFWSRGVMWMRMASQVSGAAGWTTLYWLARVS